MLLLSVTFFYTGIQLNIWSSVYATTVGLTKAFPDPMGLATISAMFVSVGEIVAGAAFGIFGKITVKRGRDPIIMIGFVLSMIAYFLAFLNLPNIMPKEDSNEKAFIGKRWIESQTDKFNNFDFSLRAEFCLKPISGGGVGCPPPPVTIL